MTRGLREEIAGGVTKAVGWICALTLFAVPYAILIPVMVRFQFADAQHLHERAWLEILSTIFLVFWSIAGIFASAALTEQ